VSTAEPDARTAPRAPLGEAEPPSSDLARAMRRALGCVAALDFAYCVAAASPYAIACLPPDAGWSSFASAAGVILLEVLAVSLPAYALGFVLWRWGARRAAVAGCLSLLVLAAFLLRIDAIMFPFFRQHVYGALALGCLAQGDADALAMTPGQLAIYGLEALAVVGLQIPGYLAIRRLFLTRWPQRSAPWVRPTLALAGLGMLVLALAAWAGSRTSGLRPGFIPASRKADLLAMQQGLLVPLAGSQETAPPAAIAAAADKGFRKALATMDRRPAWLDPLRVATGPARRPNIVIVFAESLRADAMTPEVMPEMTSFAAGATRAGRHFSTGNTTYLALFGLTYGQDAAAWDLALAERAAPPPLAALKAAGYRLHLVSGCSMAWWRLDELVLPRSMFDSYFEREGDPVADDLAVVREAGRVIDSAGGEPFCLLVFLYATHWSYYFPPDRARFRPYMENVELNIGPRLVTRREEVWNRYRNAAAFVDRSAGQIVGNLEARGLLDGSVVVFAGDHGESFHETGGFCHGSSLGIQELAVPCVVRWPGQTAGREIAGFTQHKDIFPSIFRHMGLESPQLAALSGRPHLLEGQGGASAQAGAGDKGSPRRWLLLDANRRLTIFMPQGKPRLECLGWRDASGLEGTPLTGAPAPGEAAAVEDRLLDWLLSSGAAGMWRAAGAK